METISVSTSIITRKSPDEAGQAQRLQTENNELHEEINRLRAQLNAAEQIAYHDALTGLPNRHGYDRYVAALQTLCHTVEFRASLDNGRGGMGGGLLVVQVDIDHFKSINTMLTHFGGDTVLKEFAGRLARSSRMNATPAKDAAGRCLGSLMVEEYMIRSGMTGMDLVSRWGGEEFFCLFPLCYRDAEAAWTAYDDADKIVQRLMNSIRRDPVMLTVNEPTYETIKHQIIGNPAHYYRDAKLVSNGSKHVALPVSASMGYAVIGWEEFNAHPNDDTAHLFRNVVDLMRRAKETGRNRAVTVRASMHDKNAAIHVFEGRALNKTQMSDMVH